MSEEISTNMRWHREGRINVGLLRHPADSLAWQKFDEIHPLRRIHVIFASALLPMDSIPLEHSMSKLSALTAEIQASISLAFLFLL